MSTTTKTQSKYAGLFRKVGKAKRKVRTLLDGDTRRCVEFIMRNPGMMQTEIWVNLRIEQAWAATILATLRRSGYIIARRDGKHIHYYPDYREIFKVMRIANELAA